MRYEISVIANQCAHWCGDPLTFRKTVNLLSGKASGKRQIRESRQLRRRISHEKPGDRQEVNCPKGKRYHPGVRQSEDWLAMTG